MCTFENIPLYSIVAMGILLLSVGGKTDTEQALVEMIEGNVHTLQVLYHSDDDAT